MLYMQDIKLQKSRQKTWRAELFARYGAEADEELLCIAAQGGGGRLVVAAVGQRELQHLGGLFDAVLVEQCQGDVVLHAGGDRLGLEDGLVGVDCGGEVSAPGLQVGRIESIWPRTEEPVRGD